MPTEEQLTNVIARLIEFGQLRERHGEDTIGVLMKCGAFHELDDPDGGIVDLANAVEAVEYNGQPIMTMPHHIAGYNAYKSQQETGSHEACEFHQGTPEGLAWERGWKQSEKGWGKS